MRFPRYSLLPLLLAVVALLASVAAASAADPADDLISQLMCPGSEPSQPLAASNSPDAVWMRQFIRAKSAEGWSEQRIVNTLVAQYGERILPVPPKEGFSLAAWLTPMVIIFGGAAVVGVTLSQWLRGQRGHDLIEESTRIASLNDSDLEHYQSQLERELLQFDSHGRV